jgi:hypothetical protein
MHRKCEVARCDARSSLGKVSFGGQARYNALGERERSKQCQNLNKIEGAEVELRPLNRHDGGAFSWKAGRRSSCNFRPGPSTLADWRSCLSKTSALISQNIYGQN